MSLFLAIVHDRQNVTFPEDRPTKFAEFFGDVMTVNGKVWPKFNVEARKYRLRLLNACDSRYLILQFYALPIGETELDKANTDPLPFTIIGGDDGLASHPVSQDTLLFEPSARYDILFDFDGLDGYRIVMANLGGDEPFGGEATAQLFNRTDRVMAFDVDLKVDESVPDDFDDSVIDFSVPLGETVRVRKLGLFEGRDQFNRLQPLLGTAEPGMFNVCHVSRNTLIADDRMAGLSYLTKSMFHFLHSYRHARCAYPLARHRRISRGWSCRRTDGGYHGSAQSYY